MAWDQDLERASFRGAEFSVVAVSDSIERRTTDHEYPYRDGADVDDLGRRARPTSVEAVFHGANYLVDLGAFLQVADEGETGDFVHPLFGKWQAKIINVSIDHNHSARNQARVAIELREDGTNTKVPDLFSIDSAKAAMNQSVADVQIAYDDLGQSVSAVESAIEDGSNFVEDVESTIDSLTKRMEQIRARVSDVEDAVEAITDLASYPIVRSVRTMLFSAQRLKERVERSAPKLKKSTANVHRPTSLVAHSLYGDLGRSEDIHRLNRIKNPFLVPPGQELTVPSE